MNTITFEAFETDALARGFNEVAERRWQPDEVVAEHSHPFGVEALVVQGEMWLTVGDTVQHLRPGDTFELAHGAPHAERYGPEGATYWAARRHAPVGPAA